MLIQFRKRKKKKNRNRRRNNTEVEQRDNWSEKRRLKEGRK